MTTMHAPAVLPAASSSPSAGLATWSRAAATPPIAAGAGVLLGVGDLWWNLHSPGPAATVANSCAAWAIAPFLLGAFLTLVLRTGAAVAAAAGVLMLGVAVEAYYVAGVVWLGDDPSIVTSPVAHYWLVLAVVGSALGAAGSWAAGRPAGLAILGTAAGASLLLGDALQLWQTSYAGADLDEARILAILGALVLAASVRRPWVTLGAAALCVPASVLVAAGFVATGVWM